MDLDKTSKIHSLQFRNVNKWQKVSKNWVDGVYFINSLMHQVDMPINWHFLRLSIIKQRQFLSPWEKQIRKFFEENKRKKWRIIEHYLAGLLDSPSMRRHYRRVCNSGRRDQPKTIC